MNSKGGLFRDLTRFCIFLLIYQAVVAAGYGRDQNAQGVSAGQFAAPGSRGAAASSAAGEGQTNPAGVDGAIAPLPPKTPPTPVLPVILTIGGDNAIVTYAGGVPGLAAGLMQVNVVIPSNGGPGGPVPVTIKAGANQSQPNVTVAVE